MECAKCGTSGFNRVIIDVQRGEVLGGLCEMCESSVGPLDPVHQAPTEGECLHCPRSENIALPILECEIIHEGGQVIEYDLTQTTPRLCDDCAPIPLVDQEQVKDPTSDSAI